jgi:signal transduction histidine kinase
MRASLYENNIEMWRMTEEQRRLNAAFAHDLRTPLTVLQGYIDFLTKYIPEGRITTEKTLSTLSTMDDYLKRLTKFSETMSSLQKMSEMDLEYIEIDFGFLSGQLKESIEIVAVDKNIDFQSKSYGLIYADNQVISEVFENLISNAVRYSKDNIKVMVCLDDEFLTITVSDDGNGFTKEALKNGSEPYFRENNDSNHFGIGLYISKLLCEKHGGSLILENEEGGKVTAKFSVSEK